MIRGAIKLLMSSIEGLWGGDDDTERCHEPRNTRFHQVNAHLVIHR